MPDSPTIEQAIDWPGIRAAAVQIGIRAAARTAGRDLPPDEQTRLVERVMKRASREGWETARTAIVSAGMSAAQSAHAKPLSAPVRTGADSLSNLLSELGDKCRTSAMRGAAKALGHWEQQAPEDALASSKNAKEAVGVAAIAGGWQQAGVQVGVQVNIDGLEVK